jgi:hypothetical protein
MSGLTPYHHECAKRARDRMNGGMTRAEAAELEGMSDSRLGYLLRACGLGKRYSPLRAGLVLLVACFVVPLLGTSAMAQTADPCTYAPGGHVLTCTDWTPDPGAVELGLLYGDAHVSLVVQGGFPAGPLTFTCDDPGPLTDPGSSQCAALPGGSLFVERPRPDISPDAQWYWYDSTYDAMHALPWTPPDPHKGRHRNRP